MIQSIAFQSSSSDAPTIDAPSVTLFVGPNNSGKSLVLREIHTWCTGNGQNNTRVLKSLVFEPVDEATALGDLTKVRVEPTSSERPAIDEQRAMVVVNGHRLPVKIARYVAARVQPEQHYNIFSDYHSSPYTLNLDGAGRMQLIAPQDKGDLKNPTNTFARLLVDNTKRSSLRSILLDAFGLHLGIDMSEGNALQLRYGTSSPPNERGVEDETLAWMASATPISELSDGVKAFTGILTELTVGAPRIIVIDEPEAFLHPTLAYKLGQEVAKLGNASGQHVFAATHSAQFVMGAIQSGAKVNIVRLTYRNGVGSARLLDNYELATLMKDPLLRSANAMSGIFYENVVVTEADADRAFYQEISERLLALSTEGIPNGLFLNGNGKDSVHRLVRPLRKLGIPCAAIFDIDLLAGGVSWKTAIDSCGVPGVQRQALNALRASVWERLVATGQNPKTDGGFKLLSAGDLEAANNLADQLEDYGLFVLRDGEVENWLADLRVQPSQKWLHNIFAAMGADPSSEGYIVPQAGDVWDFVRRIARWMTNSNRKGV